MDTHEGPRGGGSGLVRGVSGVQKPRAVRRQAQRLEGGLTRQYVDLVPMAERSSKTRDNDEKQTVEETVEEAVVEEAGADSAEVEETSVKVKLKDKVEADEVKFSLPEIGEGHADADSDGRVVVTKKASEVTLTVANLLVDSRQVEKADK